MRSIPSRLALLCGAAAAAVVSVRGQDLAAAPRPGPERMQSLRDLLSRQKPVSWVQIPTSPEAAAQPPTPVTATIADVRMDAETCTLSLKDGRVFAKDGYENTQTWQFKLSEIDRIRVESMEGMVNRIRSEHGHESWGAKTSPTVFVLEVEAAADHKFAVHRWSKNKANEVIERDLQQPSAFLVFADEAGAREAEKSLQGALEFCASKKPRQ